MTELPTKTEDRLATARAFVETVRGWQTQDGDRLKSRLAILRRNAGNTLAESRQITWIYGLLDRFDPVNSNYHANSNHTEEVLFLTATLLAFDRAFLEGRREFHGNFGTTCHRLWLATRGPSDTENDKPKSPVARRFGLLLDAEFDLAGTNELAFRLRQMVRQVLSKNADEIGIDWPQMLSDLKYWGHADKFVQKRWARAFYAPATESSPEDEMLTELPIR